MSEIYTYTLAPFTRSRPWSVSNGHSVGRCLHTGITSWPRLRARMTILLIDSAHYQESVLTGVRAQIRVYVCEPRSMNDWKKHRDILANRSMNLSWKDLHFFPFLFVLIFFTWFRGLPLVFISPPPFLLNSIISFWHSPFFIYSIATLQHFLFFFLITFETRIYNARIKS